MLIILIFMKIEKLTENKIRVIVKPSDLDIKNLDIRSFMTKALKEQNFFTNMLKKAKEEVGFNTDGCKLLIETFSSSDDIFIFTKYWGYFFNKLHAVSIIVSFPRCISSVVMSTFTSGSIPNSS